MNNKLKKVLIIIICVALIAAVAAAVLPIREGTFEEAADTSDLIWRYDNPRTGRTILLHDTGDGNVFLESVKPVLNFWGNKLVRYDIAEDWRFDFSSRTLQHQILGYDAELIEYEGNYLVEIESRELQSGSIVPNQFYFGFVEDKALLDGSEIIWLQACDGGFTFAVEGTPTILVPVDKSKEQPEPTEEPAEEEEEEELIIECVRAFEVV